MTPRLLFRPVRVHSLGTAAPHPSQEEQGVHAPETKLAGATQAASDAATTPISSASAPVSPDTAADADADADLAIHTGVLSHSDMTPADPPSASTVARSAPADSGASEAASAGSGRRKSVRSTRSKIDYSNLNQHLPASVDRWITTIETRTRSGQIVSGFDARETEAGQWRPGGGWRKFADGHELDRMGDEWIYGSASSETAAAPGGSGMVEPFVVERPEGLGMEMPRTGISVRVVADLVGERSGTPVFHRSPVHRATCSPCALTFVRSRYAS